MLKSFTAAFQILTLPAKKPKPLHHLRKCAFAAFPNSPKMAGPLTRTLPLLV